MALAHDIGDRIELRAAFRNAAGAYTDPTEVTFRVESPSGAVTVYTYGGATVTKNATGSYSVWITPTVSGSWYWRAEATGAVVDAVEGGFRVSASEVISG